MFTLIYLIFKQASIRARLTAGISVLVVLILILTGSFILLTAFGSHRYVNNDTVFFLSMKTQLTDNQYGIKIINTILKPFELSDLDRHLIKKELTILCHSPSKIFYCNLIIRTDRSEELENYLKEKELSFIKKEKNIFVVGKNSEKIIKSYNPFTYLKFHPLLELPSLFLVARKPINYYSTAEKLLRPINGKIKLSGETTNGNLILKPTTIFNRSQKTASHSPAETGVDLVIKLETIEPLLESWANIYGRSLELKPELTTKLKQTSVLLLLKKNELVGNAFDYYNFSLQLNNNFSIEEQVELAKAIADSMAVLYPVVETLTLSDGTKINLLKTNTKLQPEPIENNYLIKLSENRQITLIQEADKLIIKSAEIRTENESPESLFIRLNSLPEHNFIKTLLREFNFLSIFSDEIVIR
jgi:hypothetical protein